MIQISLAKQEFNNKSFTGKTSINKANFKSTQGKICFGQVFSTKNSIDFAGETKNTSRLDQALQYIDKVKKLNNGDMPPLSNLDPRQMEGILDGIDLFKGMTVYDLYLLGSLEHLGLQRGCKNQCSHCMFCAKAPNKTMKWENIEKLADGFAELKKRIGYNAMPIVGGAFLPYLDSDPMALQSKDKNGNIHNIAEAQELFYDKTEKPFGLITAGWDLEQTDCKKAAEDLVELVKRKPESLNAMVISFHPFHKWMTKSIKSSDPELKEHYRKKYIDRMTDVVVTLLPIFNLKRRNADIRSEYLPDVPADSPMSKESLDKMISDLIANVVKVCEERNIPKEDYAFLIENRDKYFFETPIWGVGRAKRLFHLDKLLKTTYRMDNSNNELKLLIDDCVNLDGLYPLFKDLYNYPVIDKYVFNINLDKRDDLITDKDGINNLIEGLSKMKQLFIDNKIMINIQTSNNQKPSEFLSIFEKLIESYFGPQDTVSNSIIKSIKVNSIDLSAFDKEINHFTDLYNLIPDRNENKRKFAREIGFMTETGDKCLDTDGSVLFMQQNEGNIEKNTYKIKGIKLNFENDNKQIEKQEPLRELNFDTKSYVISRIPPGVISRDKAHNLQNTATVNFGKKLEVIV